MQPNVVEPNSTIDNYRILRRLGMGACGAAYLARLDGQAPVAVKLANELWIYRQDADTPENIQKSEVHRQMIREEFAIMQLFDHPNILRSFHLHEEGIVSRNGVQRPGHHLYSVNQFAEGGTFLYFLMKGRLAEPLAKSLFIHLINGLNAMHTQGIIHKDLKPDNLFLSQDYSLLIADFGHSMRLDENGNIAYDANKPGTRIYNPPEANNAQILGRPLDFFMAGVIFFIMLSKKTTFYRGAVQNDPYYTFFLNNNPAGFWNLHAQQAPHLANVSQETKALINSLLAPNPLARPTYQEIIAHPSLNNGVATSEEVRAEFNARRAQVDALHQEQENQAIVEEDNFVGHFEMTQGHHRGFITDTTIDSLLKENNSEMRELIGEISEEKNFKLQEDEEIMLSGFAPSVLYHSGLDRDDLLKLITITAVNEQELSAEYIRESLCGNELKLQLVDGDEFVEISVRVFKGQKCSSVAEFNKVSGDYFAFEQKVQEFLDALKIELAKLVKENPSK